MKLEWRYHHPVNKGDISEHAEAMEGRVPAAYIDFVLKHGCGTLRTRIVCSVGLDADYLLERVYGPCSGLYNIVDKNEDMSIVLPKELYMFGGGPGAEFFLFDCRPESLGTVWFYSQNSFPLDEAIWPEELADDPEDARFYRKLANSFEDFLADTRIE